MGNRRTSEIGAVLKGDLLKLSANASVRKRGSGEKAFWKCPMCEGGQCVNPSSRRGRNAITMRKKRATPRCFTKCIQSQIKSTNRQGKRQELQRCAHKPSTDELLAIREKQVKKEYKLVALCTEKVRKYGCVKCGRISLRGSNARCSFLSNASRERRLHAWKRRVARNAEQVKHPLSPPSTSKDECQKTDQVESDQGTRMTTIGESSIPLGMR